MLVSVYARCLLVALTLVVSWVDAFPDGAPIDACVNDKPNRPNHAGTKPQPPNTHKHSFTASDDQYAPGAVIEVRINGPPFKGFFVQARDAHTNEWIGEFVKTKDVESFPECSAATHNTVPPKTQVVLRWLAPDNHSGGSVLFTGTILERYEVYWSELVAKVVPPVVAPGRLPVGPSHVRPPVAVTPVRPPVSPRVGHRRGPTSSTRHPHPLSFHPHL